MSNAIIANVYNHYLTTYAPKSTTQYDAHKKSELRTICNSIVKMNKEAPWYLEVKNKDTQEYAVSLKENARFLHNTIASLGGLDADESLEQKIAYSSDEDIVSATYVGSNHTDGPPPTLNIQINALATGQENIGAYLTNDPIELPPDTYSFDVSINDLNYEFQFNINEGETNKTVQERLVRLINNSGIGIHAKLDEGDARSSIRLSSDSTGLPDGKDLIFKISDEFTSMTQGTVDYFGLNYVFKQPSNSSFIINGEERSTSSNTFTVGNTFELEFKAVSPEDSSVTIGLKTDVESLTDNINSLIGSYNSFVSAAAAYSETQSLSNRLVKEMGSIASSYIEEMENMGIHLQSDNTLSVDEDLLTESAQSASFSSSTLKEFAASLARKSTQVSLDPMHYASRTIVAYKNPGRNFASPYTPSAYSGMMFNSYC